MDKNNINEEMENYKVSLSPTYQIPVLTNLTIHTSDDSKYHNTITFGTIQDVMMVIRNDGSIEFPEAEKRGLNETAMGIIDIIRKMSSNNDMSTIHNIINSYDENEQTTSMATMMKKVELFNQICDVLKK